MAHDVFISYSHVNKTIADAVCASLESARARCWIAPRDVRPGLYAESIVDGLNGSSVMVLVFSSAANISPQVSRELERAVSKAIPIIPFRIEEVPLSKAMEYYISSYHWIDAMTPPVEEHIESLVECVLFLLKRPRQTPPPRPRVSPREDRSTSKIPKPAPPSSAAPAARTAPSPRAVPAGAETSLQEQYPFLLNFKAGDPPDFVITWSPTDKRTADGDHIVRCRKCGNTDTWSRNPIMECNTDCSCGWGPDQPGLVFLSSSVTDKTLADVFTQELRSKGFRIDADGLSRARTVWGSDYAFASEMKGKAIFACIWSRAAEGDSLLQEDIGLARKSCIPIVFLHVDATPTPTMKAIDRRAVFGDSRTEWNLTITSALRDALYDLHHPQGDPST